MSYQLYRNTTLGHTLQESLDELIQVRCHFTPKNRNLNPLRCNSSHNISLCQQAVRLAPVIFGVSPSRVSLVDCKPYTCCIWKRQGGLTPHMINLVRKIYVLINDKYWEKIIKVISMTRNFLKRIKTNHEISITDCMRSILSLFKQVQYNLLIIYNIYVPRISYIAL